MVRVGGQVSFFFSRSYHLMHRMMMMKSIPFQQYVAPNEGVEIHCQLKCLFTLLSRYPFIHCI